MRLAELYELAFIARGDTDALEKHLEAREEAAAAARERVRLQCENSQLRAQVRVLEDMLAAVREAAAAAQAAQSVAESRLAALQAFGP